ncbi:hypothetical protein NBRC10513v2_003876 [Rhodotorula toruloides]|uniref:Uncharacterized protein n=1 Tax=Rhodotorula toruloides TaxID=5286 RepID=A0A2T0A0P1_RHOTO|nr:hypothetical protein AAT19DRAFT_10435 [Rhodotorula toruloides]
MNAGQLSPSLLERVDRLALAPGGGGRKEAEDSLEGESSGAEERLPDLSSLVVPPEVYREVDRLRKELPRLVKDFHDARMRDPPNLDVPCKTGTHLSLLVEDLSYAAEDNLDKAPLQGLADLDPRLTKEYMRGLHWSVVAENVEAFATDWLEPILAQIKDPASKPSMDETARRDAYESMEGEA